MDDVDFICRERRVRKVNTVRFQEDQAPVSWTCGGRGIFTIDVVLSVVDFSQLLLQRHTSDRAKE